MSRIHRTAATDGIDDRTARTTGRLLTDGGDDETRHQGVEFGALDDELEAIDYPISLSDLLDAHGDAELDLSGETRTLEQVLSPLGDDTFESADEVRDAVLTMVDEDAIGRERYSDRGADSPADDDESGSQESF